MLLCHPVTCRPGRASKCAPSYVFSCKLAGLMTSVSADALMENTAKACTPEANNHNLGGQMDKAGLSLRARAQNQHACERDADVSAFGGF